MIAVTIQCACGETEQLEAAACTVVVSGGVLALATRCGTSGELVEQVLTEGSLALILTTPALLDPDVRDHLAQQKAVRR